MLKVLLFAAFVALAIYVVMWAFERRRASGQAQRQHPSTGRPKRQPPRMVAPDDDEDFLRGLRPPRPSDPPAGEPPASGPTQNG